MGSNRGSPPISGVVEALLGNAFKFWRSGLALAGLIALVLAVRWLHVASHIYESRVILDLPADASEPRPNDRDPRRIERMLTDLMPELADRDGAGLVIAPDNVAVRALPDGRPTLLCRADSAQLALDHCKAAGDALQRVARLRIVSPATLPPRPLPAADDAFGVVSFSALLIGLMGGMAWMIARALMPEKPVVVAPQPRSNPPRPTHMISYAPGPSHVQLVTSAEDVRRPRGSMPEGGGSALARHSLATVQSDDPGTVIYLPLTTEWNIDSELIANPAPDLVKLRDELCVAAAQGCFVVGVTSLPECSHLKSRLAAQLAWLLAETEQARVLLLEVDFENPSVESTLQLDVPPLSGFSQQIQARIIDGGQAPWLVVRCTSHFSVLAEGRVRVPGVVYANEFSTALAQLRHHFDLIVADGPTVGREVDTRAFEDVADGIVFTTSASTAPEQALSTAKEWFRSRRLLAAASVREPRVR